jgi:nucleotide-binding universal stress UspA family protein
MARYYQELNKILVPLDGSAVSEIASVYATDLVKNQEVELILLHVLASGRRNLLEAEHDYLDRRAETINAVIEAKTVPGAPRPKIKRELVVGHAADEITGFIQNNGINLTVMTTHGRSGVSSFIMGSVANRVVKASKVPVLLIRSGKDKAEDQDTNVTRRIMIPLDGSKLSESVVSSVQTFIDWFGNEQSEITLLSVCAPSPVQSGYPVVVSEGEQTAAVKAFKHKLETKQYLSELAELLRDDGFNVTSKIVMGDPVEIIIEQARENEVNLIALATHGRSGITRMAYGSVAEAVIHGSNTPILLIRP